MAWRHDREPYLRTFASCDVCKEQYPGCYREGWSEPGNIKEFIVLLEAVGWFIDDEKMYCRTCAPKPIEVLRAFWKKHPKIGTMPEGLKLDALIDRFVMNKGQRWWTQIPKYSGDSLRALEVLMHALQNEALVYAGGEIWICTAASVPIEAPTMALAVCRAALCSIGPIEELGD